MSTLSFLNHLSKDSPRLDFPRIQKLEEKAKGIVAAISTTQGTEIGILTTGCYGTGTLTKHIPSGFSFTTENSHPKEKCLLNTRLLSFRVLSQEEPNGLSFLDKLKFAPKYIEDLNALVK